MYNLRNRELRRIVIGTDFFRHGLHLEVELPRQSGESPIVNYYQENRSTTWSGSSEKISMQYGNHAL